MKKILFLFLFFFNSFLFSDIFEKCGEDTYYVNTTTGYMDALDGLTFCSELSLLYPQTSNSSAGWGLHPKCSSSSNNPNLLPIKYSTPIDITISYCLESIYAPNPDFSRATYTEQKVYKYIQQYQCTITSDDCSEGTIYNAETCSCDLPISEQDHDSDSIPNKCDPDYVDFLTMDCNSDGESNAIDDDIDGDDILNGNDPNPYVNGSDSGTSDTPCPSTAYSLTPVKDQGSCSMDNPLFFPIPDGNTNYVKAVYWDECRQSCMFKSGTCPYGQAIQDGICKSVIPDEDDCIGTSNCQIDSWGVSPYLSCFKKCYCSTTLDPNPQTPYFSQEVSCSEVLDDKAKVNDLELSSDVNKTLPTDLLKDSNASADLDISASMKVALDSYAGAKEATQLDLLSESKIQTLQLVGANSKLSDISSSLEQFSAVSTSNQGAINNTLKGIDTGIDIGNSHLGSIDDKMTTNNSLLEDIKDLLGDSNTSGDGNSTGNEYTDSDEEAAAKASISGTLDSVYAGLNQFVQDNTIMINKIQNGFSSQGAQMSTGAEPIFCASVFGRQICINLCDSFGVFSGVLYYIFYVVFMFAALKLYFSAFKMR